MRIRFDCRHCGAGITASDWDSGRAILCSGCNRENVVPADKAPALDVGSTGVPSLSIGGGSRLQPHRKNHFLWGFAWSGLAVAAIGLCFGGLIALGYHSSANQPANLIPPPVAGQIAARPTAPIAEFANLTDESVFKSLADTPVKGLDRGTFAELQQSRPKLGEHPLALAIAKQPSAGVGMPFTFGTDSASTDQHARDLGKASAALHLMLDGILGPRDEGLAERIEADPRWLKPEMVPSLTQILIAEKANWRMTLVRMLKKIDGPSATRGLVDRAVFDMNGTVRAEAARALRERPAAEYTDRLMSAFRHPWAPAADHAAEAVVLLNRTDLAPDLRDIVDRPEPTAPTKKRIGIRDVTTTTQLVRVNHLKNCMYCHPVSTSEDDGVRGQAPDWDLPLPNRACGTPAPAKFVRADMTYLRQDFSAMIPVGNEDQANGWPAQQRFDFFVCDRPVSTQEAARYKAPETYPQREAVRRTLAHLEKVVASK